MLAESMAAAKPSYQPFEAQGRREIKEPSCLRNGGRPGLCRKPFPACQSPALLPCPVKHEERSHQKHHTRPGARRFTEVREAGAAGRSGETLGRRRRRRLNPGWGSGSLFARTGDARRDAATPGFAVDPLRGSRMEFGGSASGESRTKASRKLKRESGFRMKRRGRPG